MRLQAPGSRLVFVKLEMTQRLNLGMLGEDTPRYR